MERAFDVLGLLSSEIFRSGESLATDLGISRVAVWRQIERLKEVGLEINAVPGKGYKLCAKFEPLNVSLITKGLIQRGCGDCYDSVEVVKVIDSTNAKLYRNYTKSGPVALFAEYQTAGKGRREDEWVSPPGAGLCFSVSRWFDQPSATFSALSLVIGVSVVKALESLGLTGLQLKWPNDVVYQDAKLAGILIELRSEASGPCFVVIGVGLNVHLGLATRKGIDRNVVDIGEIHGDYISRNTIASTLLANLEKDLRTFEQEGFDAFRLNWRELDSLFGRNIQISTGSNSEIGVCEGVDNIGALRLRVDGEIKQFLSGHIVEIV